MIEFGSLPGIHRRMALLAGRGESQGTVVGRCRLHVRIDVATNAIRGKTFEASGCALFVTRLAIQSGVGSEQREAILVIANLVDRCLPSIHGMAAITLRALHASAMDVSMAVAALAADIAENWL